MEFKQLIGNPEERVYLLFLLVLAILGGMIFSGIHTFFCFVLGFLWPYYLYSGDRPKDYVLLGKWKMSYNRYSFVRFIENINHKLNKYFNPRQSPQMASLFRVFPPPLFFALLNLLLPFYIEWYFILLGALIFEFAYVYGKRGLLRVMVQKILGH